MAVEIAHLRHLDLAGFRAAWRSVAGRNTRATLPAVARMLVTEDLDARLVAGVVSEEVRAMTRRVAELAEAAMAGVGRGPPPCDYALMVLGSGGRGESLLAPDQDNAVVFAQGEPEGLEEIYLAEANARSTIIQPCGRCAFPPRSSSIIVAHPATPGN